MRLQRKTFGQIEFKADQPGAFRATIARLDAGPDKEGDVYAGPDAFPRGKAVVISAYMHTSWYGTLPVGKGVIGADEKSAWVDGEFFTNTTLGKDTYLTVKALAESGQGEWSFGYDALDYSSDPKDLEASGGSRILKLLDIFEASPVLVGAGNLTGTDSIKSLRAARALKDIKQLDSSAVALIAQIDAMTDDLDDTVDALMVALGIPDPDEEGEGTDDATDPNAPMLASAPKGATLAAQAKEAPAAVLSLISRFKALTAYRAKEGRVLSTANRDRLTSLADALNGALADITELLSATEPEGGKSATDGEAVDAWLEFEAQRAAFAVAGLI